MRKDMSGTYFDAALNSDMTVAFNGTREETLQFLRACREQDLPTNFTMVIGESLEQIDADTYVIRYAPSPA